MTHNFDILGGKTKWKNRDYCVPAKVYSIVI